MNNIFNAGNIYSQWGFSESPFQTTALPPNELGKKLLVGREKELQKLLSKIGTPPKIATVEGVNGIGKTSLVNVAAYLAYQAHLSSTDTDAPLYIPCQEVFQIRPGEPVNEFIEKVLRAIAQTLIDYSNVLKSSNDKKTKALNRWLNSSYLSSIQIGIQAGIPIFSMNLSGQRTTDPTPSPDYMKSGFRKDLSGLLKEIFPNQQSGGVIAVIDNLEILQTSRVARETLEQLRDELLIMHGIRWVLCGSLGIVLGVASSPRLEGILHSPIEIEGISDKLAGEIFDSRINAFAVNGEDYRLPIRKIDFELLHDVLNKNFRALLTQADEYCQWIASDYEPKSDEAKAEFFQKWINLQSQKSWDSVTGQIQSRHIKLFQVAVKHKKPFAVNEFEAFGLKSSQAMSNYVKELENVGIVTITRDDDDKRRKTIQITPKGWFIAYGLEKAKQNAG